MHVHEGLQRDTLRGFKVETSTISMQKCSISIQYFSVA